MKDTKKGHAIILGILAITVLLVSMRETVLVSTLLNAPFWVHVVIVGIVLSGYFAIKTTIEEKKVENEWIEQEGQVYIDRINEAREKKKLSQGD